MKKLVNVFAVVIFFVALTASKPVEQSVKPTPSTTRTARPPKGTPTVTPSPVPTATSGNSMQSWHPAGAHDGLNIHEHGDAPPAWANSFSNSNFGYPVIFGGDEASSPMENTMKHQAFKGISMTIGDACLVDLFIRYHAASNPADRSSAFHSSEVYAKDCAGNISFWQRLYWTGYPGFSNYRLSIDDPNLRHHFAIISPAEGFTNLNEQWYTTQFAWDISILIVDSATTFFELSEYQNDPMNQANWNPTGELGLIRNVGVVHRGFRERLLLDAWYCVQKFPTHVVSGNPDIGTPNWALTGAVASPSSCPSGYLPEFVSSTFPQGLQGRIETNFSGSVTVPN